MFVFVNGSIKGIYDELFRKYPTAHEIIKHRANAKGIKENGIYSWLLSLEGDEWDELLQEIEIASRKSLVKIVRSTVKETVRP